jgi:phosphate transport system substrate-binding protein
MLRGKRISPAILLLLIGTIATPEAFAANDWVMSSQTSVPTVFPLPPKVSDNLTVKVDGSDNMFSISQALKQRFERQFPNTQVQVSANGSEAALQALRDGKVDLAAVGRPLREAERQEGFVAVPLARHKIAIVVGQQNPFPQELTTEQFAQIFQGRLTDWSQIGGSPGQIRFIDRPQGSETRQSLQAYPAFQAAPFQTGPNAVQLAEDSTAAMVQQLGTDGMGYAIAEQVVGQPGIRTVAMYGTPPTDPRYPFSQPLNYVYKGPNPSPAAQAFLGLATAPQSQQLVEQSRRQAAIATSTSANASPESLSPASGVATGASPGAVASPNAVDTAAAINDAARPRYWWWWLLGIPLLGGLLWWLLGTNNERSSVERANVAAVSPPVAPVVQQRSRIILTPRDCRHAYAYWEVSESQLQSFRQRGGRQMVLRIYDVTDIDMDYQQPHSVQQYDCDEWEQDQHLPIPVDNRDYIAELVYLTEGDRWLTIARSAPVRVPACVSPEVLKASPTVIPQSVELANSNAHAQPVQSASRIILVPYDSHHLYAYWEILPEHQRIAWQHQPEHLSLRLYDVTGIEPQKQKPHSVRRFICDDHAQDLHVVVSEPGDYIGEIGYSLKDGRWLRVARSTPVRTTTAPIPSPSAFYSPR